MKKPDTIQIAVWTLLLFFAQEKCAWALQSHGPPEGIYVHQMAHVLFMGALGYLYWHTRKTPAIESKGWKYLQIFCILLFFWNLLALTGHEVSKYLTVSDFIDRNSWNEQIATPLTVTKALYFLTRMDHFLNVPAILALVVSLRTFYLEARKEGAR